MTSIEINLDLIKYITLTAINILNVILPPLIYKYIKKKSKKTYKLESVYLVICNFLLYELLGPYIPPTYLALLTYGIVIAYGDYKKGVVLYQILIPLMLIITITGFMETDTFDLGILMLKFTLYTLPLYILVYMGWLGGGDIKYFVIIGAVMYEWTLLALAISCILILIQSLIKKTKEVRACPAITLAVFITIIVQTVGLPNIIK